MVVAWRINNDNSYERSDMRVNPAYIWEADVPLQAIWKWDDGGPIWSTGTSDRCLRSTLYLKNPASHQYRDWIHWLTLYNPNSAKGYCQDYYANKVTPGFPTVGVPYHNFVKHTASVRITFKPAAPYLTDLRFDVIFFDYLNYFYQRLSGEAEDTFIWSLPQNASNIDFKGDWLIWHSSRLEEEDLGRWDPPDYPNVPGLNYDRVAITVLRGMPSRGVSEQDPYVGNINKGRGMAPQSGAIPPGDYSPRGPISIPMFMGPGTIQITEVSGELIATGMHNESTEYPPPGYPLPRVVNSRTIGIEPVLDNVINQANPITIPVQSILKNFEDAYKWVGDWDDKPVLIRERPYDTDDEDNPLYYGGEVEQNEKAPYTVNEITLNPTWVTHAASFNTKYAIVFLMGRGETPIDAKFFVERYSQYQRNNSFTPTVIVAGDGQVKELTDIEHGAFAFKSNYKYIINPNAEPAPSKFTETEFEVTMPPSSMYYQFAALIYQIVAATDITGYNYKVDPAYPYPIEYWCGISSPDGGKDRFMSPQVQKTGEQKLPPATEQQTPTGNETQHSATTLVRVDDGRGTQKLVVKPLMRLTTTLVAPTTTKSQNLPDAGSYIRFFLVDLMTNNRIWNDTITELPISPGESVSREILFLPGNALPGREFQMYRQLYDPTHRPLGAPKRVGPTLVANNTHYIESLTVEVISNAEHPLQFKLSQLKMPNAPEDASYYYTFKYWVGDALAGEEDLETPCHPNNFSWDVDFDDPIPDSTECDLILYIYDDEDRAKLLASYYRLYTSPHYITLFTVKDVFPEEHPEEERFLDNGKVKVQFKFTANTRLLSTDTRYKCRIFLYPYTDVPLPPDTPYPPLPDPIMTWDYESITNVFETVEEPIDIYLGTYRFVLQLIEKATEVGRERFFASWETPQQRVSGWIIGGGAKIPLSTPSRVPSEQGIEYRMLRDGVLGTVESPWEMRTESVIGGNTVTQPAWIVRPRTVSFRVIVTAPPGLMKRALHDLIAALSSAPTEGVELQLQTTDSVYQLSIFGYIQVGSPKIEIREDTVSIVSVVMDCPNYAWRGHTKLIKCPPKMHDYLITPTGHISPSVDIWIAVTSSKSVTLRVNDNPLLKLTTGLTDSYYLHIHHNPIIQEYFIEKANSEPNTIPPVSTNNGRSMVRRRYAPLSAHSIILGDEETKVTETQNMFDLIEPDSYLPIILEPSKENRIEVIGGYLTLIEYVPHYAFWW